MSRRNAELRALTERVDACESALRAAVADGTLIADFEQAIFDEQRALFLRRLKIIARWLHALGAFEAWRVLYIRFGTDVTDEEDGWALGEVYSPGREWEFVYGPAWRSMMDYEGPAEPAPA